MTITAFDTSPIFTDVITQNGVVVDLTGATVTFLMRSSVGGPVFSASASITSNQTSGTLTIGAQYKIITYVSGDDFTNVGGTNVTGTIFTATGTTPTNWSHSSALSPCSVTYSPSGTFPTVVGNYNQSWKVTLASTKTLTYPGSAYNPVRIIENLNES